MPSIPSQEEIILLSRRVKAHKGLGQNFLVDTGALDRWLDFLESLPKPAVYVEIGPGTGILTQLILQQEPVQYYGIDLDVRWIQWIRSWDVHFVELVQMDVIGYDFSKLLSGVSPHQPKILVGNIPYHISGPLMIQLIYHAEDFDVIALLMQKEVAERLSAPVGGSDYGRLSVLTQLMFEVEILETWKPHIFIPSPTVDSSLISFKRRQYEVYLDIKTLLPQVDHIARLCFQNRRKIIKSVLTQNKFSEDIVLQFGHKRAQELSVEEYVVLARAHNSRIVI